MKNVSELEQFRKDKDELFGTQSESPLTDGQKEGFKGLKYYPENTDLILKGISLEPENEGEVVEIPTSTGDTQPYKKLGKIKFEVAGTPTQLTVFESSDGSNIFLSFRDQTNKSATYHDGRYIEVEIENNKIHELDLNYAYNPYCAYNDNFRCPITPEENTINAEVKAGEKRYR